ncbi:hypothetical protein QE152_g34922 [Popillia japonica]|uniref:Zinc finger PHD-type domain-containing protein n=1 Tax=Popillia japonica TaxID=7064 RepID=A0AAW1ITI8_POPJA
MSSICGRCNKQMQPKDMVVVCSGICKGKYHTSCVDLSHQNYTAIKECDLSHQNYTAIKECGNIKYFCNGCLPILDFCMNMQREMNALKDLMNQKLIEFQKVISTNSYLTKSELRKQLNPSALEVGITGMKSVKDGGVIIKCKNKEDVEKIKKALEVGITGMKSVKDGGVIIKCKNKEDVEKIKKAAEKKMKKKYDIKIPEQKNPCIKVTDIEEDMSEEELKTSIINQNSCMQHDNLDVRVLVIKKMIPEQKNPCIKVTDIEEDMSEEELKTSIINQNSCMQHDNLDVRVLVIKKMRSKFMAILEVDPVSFRNVLNPIMSQRIARAKYWFVSLNNKVEHLEILFDDADYDVLSRLCRNCRDVVIICGDFNVDRLVDSDENFELQNILRNFNIEILSNEPTRITPTSATCLDGFRYLISTESWKEVYETYSVDDGFRTFSNILGYYHDAAFPLKRYTGAQLYKNPWMTAGIYRSSRTVKELYATAVRSKSVADFEYYKTYKRIYKEVIQKAKQMYNDYKYNSATNKTKAVWDIINTCSNKAEKEAVTLFDEKLVRTNWIASPTIGSLEKSVFIEPVTETTVYNIINGMKSSNSVEKNDKNYCRCVTECNMPRFIFAI